MEISSISWVCHSCSPFSVSKLWLLEGVMRVPIHNPLGGHVWGSCLVISDHSEDDRFFQMTWVTSGQFEEEARSLDTSALRISGASLRRIGENMGTSKPWARVHHPKGTMGFMMFHVDVSHIIASINQFLGSIHWSFCV